MSTLILRNPMDKNTGQRQEKKQMLDAHGAVTAILQSAAKILLLISVIGE